MSKGTPGKRSHVTVRCPRGHKNIFRRGQVEPHVDAQQLKKFDAGKRDDVAIPKSHCPECSES